MPIILLTGLLGFGFNAQAQVVINPLMTDSLAGDQNNDGLVNPGDTIQYKITIPSSGSQGGEGVNYQHTLDTNSSLVVGSIKTTPLALNDTLAATCAGLTLGAPGILSNDFDDNIPGLTVVWNSSPSNLGQAIAVASDGSFTYPSTEDFNATDNFRYAVQDTDGNTDTGFAFVTVNSLDQLIFVDKSGPNGIGTSTSPYNNLADAQANSAPGDTIFLYEDSPGSYANGIVLQNNQVLLGEEAGLASKCITIAPGSRPSITNSAGNAITVAQNNVIKGIKASNSTSGFSIDDNGDVGTLTIRNVEVSNSLGGAFRADNGGTLDVVLDAAGSLNGDHAIRLNGCNGSFTVNGNTDVGGTSSTCVNITNNAATLSFANLLINTNSNNQKGLVVDGGSVNAASGIVTSGSAAALEINGAGTSGFTLDSIYTSGTSGNAVDLVNCAGTWSLGKVDIGRTTGTAINIDEVDTVNALGGTINSTNGTVLDINEAALGMTLGLVSSNSSSGAGIQLDDISGTLTMNGGSITAASGTAFDVGGTGNGSGGNATVLYAGNITNTSNRSVFIQELGGGSIVLSGNINDSGGGIKVSEINNGTAASVIFSGSSKVVSTGTSNAIELADNTNGTVSFINGGLDIDATSGTGFNSTNGGTINVSGANNTATTTTGRAVDIDNAVLGITFKSISSNGGSNPGIDLNTTTGNFAVNGDGTIKGSGGLLQNISSEAVLLTNVSNVSFNGLNMTNITKDGIKGVEVNGLTVSNGSFSNIGSADPHDVFGFNREALGGNGVVGAALFQNLTLSNFHERAIDIVNEGNGSLDLDIVNVSADDNADSGGEDAIRVQGEGFFNTDVLLSGGTFNNIESDVFAYFAQGTGVNNVVITGVTSTNGGGPDNNPNGGGLSIIGSGGSTTVFNINSNNLTGVQGEPILIVGLPGPGQTLTMNGTIGGNAGGLGNTLSSDNADGISLDFDGDLGGTSTINATVDINNNIISFDDDGAGIDFRDAAGTGNITVRNNIFSVINGDDGTNDSDDGVFIFSDDDVGIVGTAKLNVAILNNTFTGITGTDNIVDVEDIRDTGVSGCFRIFGNSVTSGVNRISLDFDATGNGGSVPQSSTAQISGDNNGATVTIVDQNPTFNSIDCNSVPLP